MRAISGARLLLAAALSVPGRLPGQVERGVELFHQGQYLKAAEVLEKSEAGDHQRVFLALARAATGGCATVTEALRDSFRAVPDAVLQRLAGLGLVQCLAAQGRDEEALTLAAQLKSRFPDDADVLYQAARLHMRVWNDIMFQMFQKTPGSYRVNQISGEVLETQGNHAEAASEYRKAIAKNPAALNLHYRLGRALLMQSHAPENLEAARREFEAELALNPNDAVAEYQVGQILQTQGKSAEAAARFERAAALRPDDFPEAMVAVAKLRTAAGRHAEATGLLERAVKLQPANEGARYALMLAYRNAGRAEDAAREAAALEKLRKPPEGEFTNFLKKLGEKAPPPKQ